ncbi:MAG: homoserine dehydrogenase [Candidatus Caldarchaeum sp.]|nr:homoserine dehydrogenase [Candidatus Caldarchaeum sp.]MDW8435079.1 homoserine dehydrogenase [Candidatus Caldarchaeum sp.]
MRVALVGLGVVGRSFLELVAKNRGELVSRYGLGLRVVFAADRSGGIYRASGLSPDEILDAKREGGISRVANTRFYANVLDALQDFEADVLVDATPTNIVDGEPSYSIIRRAILREMDVVTVSKGALALYMPALKEMASRRNVLLKFSGTVGGGMPVLAFARECSRADRVEAIEGILNGTTNYILTKMEEEGLDFRQALAEAQRLGYAEADPSLDVKGLDTACKITILANEVLGMKANVHDVKVTGIENVSAEEVNRARYSGKAVRLVAFAGDGKIEVRPRELDVRDPLAVKMAMNAVRFKTTFSGSHVITGKGAGGTETATAIIRDITSIKIKRTEAGENA